MDIQNHSLVSTTSQDANPRRTTQISFCCSIPLVNAVTKPSNWSGENHHCLNNSLNLLHIFSKLSLSNFLLCSVRDKLICSRNCLVGFQVLMISHARA